MDSIGAPVVSRRCLLGTLGTAGIVGITGCLRSSGSITVLSAGSLTRTFETHLGPAFADETGVAVQGEYYGTNAVLRMVEDRTKRPDVIVAADAQVLRDRLYGEFTDWDVAFASNQLGIAYNHDTAFGRRLDAGEPWYEAALDTTDGDLSIADPELDPLGYRAVMAFDIAESVHGRDGLRDDLLRLVYEDPAEPQMLAGIESGARAGAVAYRNMAADHGLPFLSFPDEYNFGDPTMADRYATVSYSTGAEGPSVEGRPILYSATVTHDGDGAGRRFVAFLIERADLLRDAGLMVGNPLPRVAGHPPEGLLA